MTTLLRDLASSTAIVLRDRAAAQVIVQGFRGVPGGPGPAGPTLTLDGDVATYADLPTSLGADNVGQLWLVDGDGLVYRWSGTDFPADGSGAPLVQGGMSQAQADARYAQKAGGNEGDVVTKRSGDAVWAAPAIPWASTNW